jgi:hypothetical protein
MTDPEGPGTGSPAEARPGARARPALGPAPEAMASARPGGPGDHSLDPERLRLLCGRRAGRLEAIELLDLAPGPAGAAARFALRAALLFDRAAEVRAAAAARLGDAGPEAAPWLRAAIRDPLPSVREAAYRSLGRLRDRDAAALARHGARHEPVW